MLIGYARISTGEENLDTQMAALQQAGCERVFTDETGSVKSERPALQEAFALLNERDTLVVWRLDRLGRSLQDLVRQIEALAERGAGFRSLQEKIDTTGSQGECQSQLFAALSECQRHLTHDRTIAGLRAARARGRMGGRRRQVTPEQVELAAKLMKDPSVTIGQICSTLGVSKSTLYRYVNPRGEIRQP